MNSYKHETTTRVNLQFLLVSIGHTGRISQIRPMDRVISLNYPFGFLYSRIFWHSLVYDFKLIEHLDLHISRIFEMQRFPLIRLCLFVTGMVQLLNQQALAYKRENRIPLSGCRGHFAASGTARYVANRNESKTQDREELIVEIKNVPMRPGTTLVVYVTDEAVGTIKLDAKQGGTLKLTSSFNKFVPPLDESTSVVLKTVDGRMVMW